MVEMQMMVVDDGWYAGAAVDDADDVVDDLDDVVDDGWDAGDVVDDGTDDVVDDADDVDDPDDVVDDGWDAGAAVAAQLWWTRAPLETAWVQSGQVTPPSFLKDRNCCHIKLLESPIPAAAAPAPAPPSSALYTQPLCTKRGTIDPLVSKRPEIFLNKKIKN